LNNVTDTGEVSIKKKFIPSLGKSGEVVKPMMTRNYPVLDRVAEMQLLTKTAEAGLLTVLTV
jgi:hypothetical protein